MADLLEASPPAATMGGPVVNCVEVPQGDYRIGEGTTARTASIGDVQISRWPVTNGDLRPFLSERGGAIDPRLERKALDPCLIDHPATEVTFQLAHEYCGWLSRRTDLDVRLPTSEEWEVVARGNDERPWPWGWVFDATRCACVDAGWGWTVPVTAHRDGASPFGAEQLAGNVWEWVEEPADHGDFRVVRGGSYLDTGWGLRAARWLLADPTCATATTGFRIAHEVE